MDTDLVQICNYLSIYLSITFWYRSLEITPDGFILQSFENKIKVPEFLLSLHGEYLARHGQG